MATDPVGLAGASGAGPIQPGRTPAGGRPIDPNAPTFKDTLLKNLESVNRLQADATEAVEDLATGRRDDLETVLMATQKADTAFRMLLATRNKVLEAYEELKRIQV
jgi:flagellar hook-basal body complex protein FliE